MQIFGIELNQEKRRIHRAMKSHGLHVNTFTMEDLRDMLREKSKNELIRICLQLMIKTATTENEIHQMGEK